MKPQKLGLLANIQESVVTVRVLEFENKIAGTSISGANGKFKIGFLQFLDDGFVVGLPPKSCALNHRVTLKIEFRNESDTVTVDVTAKVEAVESGVEEHDSVQLKILSVDAKLWDKVQQLYRVRQNGVSSIFTRMRE